MIKRLVFIGIVSVFFLTGFSQKTATYNQPDDWYKKGLELFNKAQYGSALNQFENTIKYIHDDNSQMQINAEYYKALCAIELFNDNAEELLKEFLEKHPESAHVKYINFQLGKFQFRKKNFKNAIKSFQKVDIYDLTLEEKTEFYFKNGYAFFALDSFAQAKKYLFEVLNRESKYKPSAQYYYSHCAYIEGNYQTALKGFKSLTEDETFKHIVPYYITHIYYLQENYDELLKIAPSLYETSTPKRKPEIARIIGEAYYRTDNYVDAIKYLEIYHGSSGTNPSEVDQYQLGYAYYKTGNFKKAIENFKIIAFTNDSMAQNVNYHLAYSYIMSDDKKFALNAFQEAYKIGKIASITEDALYNFAKLSYELDYNPYNQAIDAFQTYVTKYPKALHRVEAMEYLSKMYLSTKNYEKALASIEQIPNKSPELQNAYQRILYSRGVEVFITENYPEALKLFDKSLQLNKDKKLNAKSLYWKGETLYRMGKYENSISVFNQFLTSSGAFDLPEFNMAYYQIGYGNFKRKLYDQALTNYRIFTRNYTTRDQFLNDAYLRIGDCYFISRQFDEAIVNYDNAVQIGLLNNDYALMKKAESYGLTARFSERVATLKKLVDEYPASEYVGNAEFELAETQFKNLDNKAEAIKYFDQIIAKYPKDKQIVKKAYLGKALVYDNMGNDEEAIKNFTYVVKNYRGTEESREALIKLRGIYIELNQVATYIGVLESMGVKPAITEQDSINYLAAETVYFKSDCQKASQMFDGYISSFSTGAYLINAHYYLADCQFRSSNFDVALQHYQYVVGKPVSKFTENALLQMAYIYFDKRKDYALALEMYEKIIKIAEFKMNSNTAKLGKMRCLWNLGKYQETIMFTQDVLAIEGLDENDKIEANMLKGKSAMKTAQDTIAISSFTQVVKMTKSEYSAEARYYLALLAFNKKEFDKAESLTFDVIEQVPSYEYWVVKSFILSADIFVQTGNIYQAKATLKSVIDLYTGDQGLIDEAKSKLKAIVDKETQLKIDNTKKEEMIEIGNEKEDKLFNEIPLKEEENQPE